MKTFRTFALVLGLVSFGLPLLTAKADSPPAVKDDESAGDFLQRVGLVRRTSQYQRDYSDVRGAFRDVVSAVRTSTVRVMGQGSQVAMGAVIDERGYVATKASELKEPLECVFSDGRKLPASILGVHADFDLALLKVEGEKFTCLKWRDSKLPGVGSWLATAGLDSLPLAIGVVSVAARPIDGDGGVLGIVLEQSDKGPIIREVMSNSGASRAGLQVDDVIRAIDGQAVPDRTRCSRMIRKHQPGDTLSIKILRGDKEFETTASVAKPAEDPRAERRDSLNAMGGPLSERRRGFPSVLQHDTVLKPNECGGPVVDLDGNAVGLNIARGGRVESYLVPAGEVKKLLPDLIAGKLKSSSQTVATAAKPAPAAGNGMATTGQPSPAP